MENVMGRPFLVSFASLLLACLPLTLAAQSPEPPSADEASIRSLEEQERVAVLNQDVPALERLWAEQFIVNNPQNEISADRGAVLDRVRRGLIRYAKFERRIEVIRFTGDIAIVMGSEIVVPKTDGGGSTQTVHRRFTNIWTKSGTSWRAIARHANVIPNK
jgi:ketosteroid isomerase-like protein